MAETSNSPKKLSEILVDIDAVVSAEDTRSSEAAARDLEDERRATAEKIEEQSRLAKENPDAIDEKAVEVANQMLVDIDIERLARGGNPDVR